MGRSEDFKKLPRFDDAPESLQRPEIPPPPRMPSLSPPEVGQHVAPPLRGARPDTVPPTAMKKSSAPPPPPVRHKSSAPPPPPARVHSAAPETEPVERIDMHAILRTPMPPPLEEPVVADLDDEFSVEHELVAEDSDPSDAPTMQHRAAKREIPKRNDEQPSIAPVSMSSDELIEVTHVARNNRLARVGYAAVAGATLVAGLYVWRMQPMTPARTAAAAVPLPFIKEPAQLIATTAQPVIERTADSVAVAEDKTAAEKASAQAAAANQTASVSKRRSSKESKSEGASDTASEATREQASAAVAESAPTQPAEPAKTESAPSSEQAATAAPAEEAAPELPPFNQAAAQTALDAAAGRAAGCLKEGEPAGLARVVVTFAPSGRVTSASVDGPPYAGTPTGGCIARAFRSAEIAPFSGKLMTVGKTVTLR